MNTLRILDMISIYYFKNRSDTITSNYVRNCKCVVYWFFQKFGHTYMYRIVQNFCGTKFLQTSQKNPICENIILNMLFPYISTLII